jgi:hypothetical protein
MKTARPYVFSFCFAVLIPLVALISAIAQSLSPAAAPAALVRRSRAE